MNKKQYLVLALTVAALAAIIVFTPRYKIVKLEKDNYVTTEATSPLYKRSKGNVRLHWDVIALRTSLTLAAAGAFLFALRRKDGQ